MLFWLVVLSAKFSFAYFLQVSSSSRKDNCDLLIVVLKIVVKREIYLCYMHKILLMYQKYSFCVLIKRSVVFSINLVNLYSELLELEVNLWTQAYNYFYIERKIYMTIDQYVSWLRSFVVTSWSNYSRKITKMLCLAVKVRLELLIFLFLMNLQIEPLVSPTRIIVKQNNIPYSWHDFVSSSKYWICRYFFSGWNMAFFMCGA